MPAGERERGRHREPITATVTMFTVHKPRVYKSAAGCCICKAKSSTSRFTCSSKYEMDFQTCFRLSAPRKGEMCNACVLLVKRFQRLPSGSVRHWGHVVDARAGPGTKCMTKVKKKSLQVINIRKIEECDNNSHSGEDESWSDDYPPSDEDTPDVGSRRKKSQPKKNNINRIHNIPFIDKTSWEKVPTQCSTVWSNGVSTAIELGSFHSCPSQSRAQEAVPRSTVLECGETTVPNKVFSDNSSDSGFDESSHHLSHNPTGTSGVAIKRLANNITVITNVTGKKIQR